MGCVFDGSFVVDAFDFSGAVGMRARAVLLRNFRLKLEVVSQQVGKF